jgi:hypothetical protein
VYFDVLHGVVMPGTAFKDLVTGVGKASIGIRSLLRWCSCHRHHFLPGYHSVKDTCKHAAASCKIIEYIAHSNITCNDFNTNTEPTVSLTPEDNNNNNNDNLFIASHGTTLLDRGNEYNSDADDLAYEVDGDDSTDESDITPEKPTYITVYMLLTFYSQIALQRFGFRQSASDKLTKPPALSSLPPLIRFTIQNPWLK